MIYFKTGEYSDSIFPNYNGMNKNSDSIFQKGKQIMFTAQVNTEPKKSRLFHLDVVISKVTLETIFQINISEVEKS